MAFLGKEYKYEGNENYDNFVQSCGLPEDVVAKILESNASSKVVKNGDIYSSISTTPEGTRVTEFKSGVEFDYKIRNKIPVKITYTVDGNTITQVVKSDCGVATFKKVYNGDELVVTMSSKSPKFESAVAKRWYKA